MRRLLLLFKHKAAKRDVDCAFRTEGVTDTFFGASHNRLRGDVGDGLTFSVLDAIETACVRDHDLRLYLGQYIGEVANATDSFAYNGRIYTIGKFRQSTCLGKNCASSREEYEACSVPQ